VVSGLSAFKDNFSSFASQKVKILKINTRNYGLMLRSDSLYEQQKIFKIGQYLFSSNLQKIFLGHRRLLFPPLLVGEQPLKVLGETPLQDLNNENLKTYKYKLVK